MDNNNNKLNLYIIAGCNGAGKTTASFTVLPEMLDCHEFVNADEIARGLSPFHPEGVAIQAGRLMIERVIQLLKEGETFAFETTLSTRSYVKLIQQAQRRGYFVTLLFFSLATPEQAVQRVAKRVSQGGHNIPTDVIYRRFESGLANLFNLYMPIVDYWALYDNSNIPTRHIASGERGKAPTILEPEKWQDLQTKYKTNDEQEKND
ncbi:MAG: zeta toxin family protein [Bacteroidaceae bacterium]|nr:zeta toxin family protein [Bacteroidaceae bacterium]